VGPVPILVRSVRRGDGPGCARAWLDAGRHYAVIIPDIIQEPAADGLAEWFEGLIAAPRSDDERWLVAVDGLDVVGSIGATLRRPHPQARWQIQRDLSTTRLSIDVLVVAETHRRRGVGTLLMAAAEEWGRQQGATVAVTDTNLRSEMSVPFYEQRMGYARQAVILRKPLP
jgi:GNAT superfamily N-acetyltransferase